MFGLKAKFGPTSFYTRSWRPKGPQKFAWMKKLYCILHGSKWIILHGLLDIMLSPSKKGGSNAKLGAMIINPIAIGSLKYYSVMMGTYTWNCVQVLNMVHFHLMLSLKANQLQNWISNSHHMGLWTWLSRALIFYMVMPLGMCANANGLLNGYGVNSHNFIIKYVCTFTKATGSYWHLCLLSCNWVWGWWSQLSCNESCPRCS